jgi:hypothetical protein
MRSIPFDVFATLLIFLISVPTLIVQTMAPEVRHLVLRRERRRLLLMTGTPVVSALILFLLAIWLQIYPLRYLFPSFQLPEPWPAPDNLIWTVLFAVLFPISAVTAFYIPRRYGRREAIVRHFERGTRRKTKTDGRLIEDYLTDLIELGRQSEPGQDKEVVLAALAQLTEDVLSHQLYKGDALETLVLGLVTILDAGAQPGTSGNYSTAGQILQQIITRHSDRASGSPLGQTDQLFAVRALSKLGQSALLQLDQRIEVDSLVIQYVQDLQLLMGRRPEMKLAVSEALFEIGRMAVRQNQMFVAVASLDILTLVISQSTNQVDEALAGYMLGLASHLWSSGNSVRPTIKDKLHQVNQNLPQPLPLALQSAKEYYIRQTIFQIADNLEQMHEDMYKPASNTSTSGGAPTTSAEAKETMSQSHTHGSHATRSFFASIWRILMNWLKNGPRL